MVTGQNANHRSKAALAEIKRLKQTIKRLREDGQLASDQRDIVIAEHAGLAEAALCVAATATRDDDNPDVDVVPAEAMDRMMFVLRGWGE